MKPVLFTVIILLVAINLLLGITKLSNFDQAKFLISSIPNNQIFSVEDARAEVAGIQKFNLPPRSKGLQFPQTSASAVVVFDVDTNTVLYSKDSEKRVPIASTTKIMTALVGSEHFKSNDILTVSNSALVDGSNMGLKLGEKLSFRSLLYGMLLNSGNDAAFTIAANYPGGLENFVTQMNKKAQDLGLINTHFENPAGFDNPLHYSSAADMAKIALIASKNSQLTRVVSTKQTMVASIDKSIVHTLKNLNKLLDEPGVLGIKTGTTPLAKENLVGLMEKNNHKILTVVLGSDDRFGETQELFAWTFENFIWD